MPLENKPLVIIVDDNRTIRLIARTQCENDGYHVLEAENGKQGLDLVTKHGSHVDALILDREMPEMNGLQVVADMKASPELRHIPIIMQTGSDKPEQIKEGIDAGVFYYLTKPFNNDVLKSVTEAAIRESEQQRNLGKELAKHRASFNLIKECKFEFQTMEEAESLAGFIANCYPNPKRVLTGLAELMKNAVEHGNYAINYDEKTQLLEQNLFDEELKRRSSLPEYKDKIATVYYKVRTDGIVLSIEDQGAGFDWGKFIEVDPSRALDNHGRGIAQAKAISFDRIEYNETGNKVGTFVSNEEELDW